jgi:tetratricopeptide (TPR) repeat protein
MNRATWWIAAAVIAAAAVCAAVVAWREPRDPLVRMARAAGKFDTRLTEARLSGFAFRPKPTASHPQSRDAAHLRFRALAGEVLQSTAHDDHAAGVAALLLGANDDAVKRLTACAETHPNNASVWNDLAAARYTAANANDDPQQLVSALAAADHALRLTDLREAEFNRGLILQGLGLYAAADKQYQAYAASERTPGWLKEVRQRIANCTRPTAAEAWLKISPLLRQAVRDHNSRQLQQIVIAFPQEARTWTETIFLDDWATAVLSDDSADASERLYFVSSIAHALASIRGEKLLADALVSLGGISDHARIYEMAAAQHQYVTARRLYKLRRFVEAEPLFQAAADSFANNHSPLVDLTRYYVALCRFDQNDDTNAEIALRNLLTHSDVAHRALRAQVLWSIATVLSRRGHLVEALAAASESRAIFRSLGETLNAQTLSGEMSNAYSMLGQRLDAWRSRREVFAGMSASGDHFELQRAVGAAAETEVLGQHWSEALSLLKVATGPDLRENQRYYVHALVSCAFVAKYLGSTDEAANYLVRAKAALPAVPEGALRGRTEAEILFAEALLCRARTPQRANTLLNHYIERIQTAGTVLELPEALLERARARKRSGWSAAAISDLRAASELLRQRRKSPDRDAVRDAFFNTNDSVARELTEALVDCGDIAGAFAAIDEARADAFASSIPPASPFAIPSNLVVIEYVELPRRLLIFAAAKGIVHLVTVPVTYDAISAACDASGQEEGRCSAILIQPIEKDIGRVSRLVIVPDREIEGVHFAALRLASTGRYLMEHSEITISPGASLASGATQAAGNDCVVALANPTLDVRFGRLPALPAAEREATRIAAMYPRSVLLTRAAATRARMIAALAGCSVLHLGTHAIPIASDPRLSAFVFAPSDGDGGSVTLADLAKSDLHSLRVVVLVGCSTGRAERSETHMRSLALATLAAGVRYSVATMNDIEDSLSAHFSFAFHAALRGGAQPGRAMREAQLSMLHSPDPAVRTPNAWSAFVLYGHMPQE